MVRRKLLQTVLAGAKTIAAPSPFVSDWYTRQGIPSERIQLLPLGLQLDDKGHHGHAMNVDAEKADGRVIDSTVIKFLYVGGIAHTKGIHTVIQAFRALQASLGNRHPSQRPKAELWIVGDDLQDPEYVQTLRNQGDSGIRFHGRQSSDAVRLLMQSSQLILIPSLWDETFNFVAYEALLANRPVFASDVEALSDLIRDGENGRLLPPGGGCGVVAGSNARGY